MALNHYTKKQDILSLGVEYTDTMRHYDIPFRDLPNLLEDHKRYLNGCIPKRSIALPAYNNPAQGIDVLFDLSGNLTEKEALTQLMLKVTPIIQECLLGKKREVRHLDVRIDKSSSKLSTCILY